MRYIIFLFFILSACQQQISEAEKQTLAYYQNQIKMGREQSFNTRQKTEYKELLIKHLQQPDSIK